MRMLNLSLARFNTGCNVSDTATGENAAWGSVSPEEVVNDWMKSTRSSAGPMKSFTLVHKLQAAPSLDEGRSIEEEESPL